MEFKSNAIVMGAENSMQVKIALVFAMHTDDRIGIFVYAKDGFRMSLQIHNGAYCESENGYQQLGHTFVSVECDTTNDDNLLKDYEDYSSIPVSVLEQVFEKHGGIDWERTISTEQYHNDNFLTQDAKWLFNHLKF